MVTDRQVRRLRTAVEPHGSPWPISKTSDPRVEASAPARLGRGSALTARDAGRGED